MTAGRASAAIVVLALAGCTPSSSGDFDAVTAEDVTALVSTQSGSGMDAQVRGQVALTDGGCFAIDDGSGPIPVVWPESTSIDGEGLALPSGARIAVGDEVVGGGGEVSTSDFAESVPEACSDSVKVLLVHQIEPA